MSEAPATPPREASMEGAVDGGLSQGAVVRQEESSQAGISSVELEKLVEISQETTRKLHVVWDEMGLSEEERSIQLASLVQAVEQVFVQKVDDECAMRDGFINESQKCESEINSLLETLGEERRQTPPQQESTLMLNLTWLRSELVHLKSIKEERLAKLINIQAKLVSIWSELGAEPNGSLMELEKFLTPAGMQEYAAALAGLQNDRTKRIAIIQEHINELNDLFEELVVDPEDETDRAILAGGESLGISESVLGMLEERASVLSNLKIKRTEQLKQLGAQIQPLWEKLEVDEDARTAFFLENRGLGLAVIDQCQNELERLLRLKQERMGSLIDQAKDGVESLWNEMHFSDEERETFTQQTMMGPVEEATLNALELEIARLEEKAQVYRPILKLINTYNRLCEERILYQERVKDPKRLLTRARGNNLQEEAKMEARVKKGIPKKIEDIQTAIAGYEAEHGPFLLDGRRFVETMEENEANVMAQQEEEKRRKKAANNRGNNENRNHQNVRPAGPTRATKAGVASSSRMPRPSSNKARKS